MKVYEILFVDDDPDFREEHRGSLLAAGFVVTEAESAKQAAEVVQTRTFDLAIVDLMMERPDSGFTLAYHLRKQFPDMPIIMVSGVNSEMGLHFSLETPGERDWIKANVFINKPLRYEQLEAEIHHLLGIEEVAHH